MGFNSKVTSGDNSLNEGTLLIMRILLQKFRCIFLVGLCEVAMVQHVKRLRYRRAADWGGGAGSIVGHSRGEQAPQ